MKHFNFKTLAIGAAMAGAMLTTNAYAEKDSHGLDEKTLCTLRNNGRYLALKGFNDGAGWGDFNGPNGGNGRIYLERVGEDKYIVGGQGLFITSIADGVLPTAGAKADAIQFTVTGDTQTGLAFEHNGVYLQKGNGTTAEQKWEFNVFGDNGYKAQLDGGQQINVGADRYSVVMFPFQVSAPAGKTLYKYSSTTEDGKIVFAPIAEGEALPGGEPGIYKTTSDDGDFRLNIVFTDGEKGSAIAEYVDEPKTMGDVFTGFYSKPGYNSDGNIFMLGVKNGNIGFYKDLTNAGDCADGNYKQDQTNIAYLKANAEVPYYKMTVDGDNLVFASAGAVGKLVDQCVALVASLNELKANEGTDGGQYNVTEAAVGAEGWAIWNDLASYDAAEDAKYAEISEEDANALIATLTALVDAVKATKVEGLPNFSVVTLQWNGEGRYAGCNGGTGWTNLNTTFGSPNGGNGRIGIVKKQDGTYAIATQGLFLKLDADGKMNNATDLNEATGFTITENGEGELQFKSADGWCLTGQNFGTSKEIGENDGYKMNSWGDYAIAKQDMWQVADGVYMATICLPYNVTVPEGATAYTVTVENGALVTTAVTEIPAGTPVICVGNGGQVYMSIPQKDQNYVSTPLATTALTGWFNKSNTDYIFDIKEDVFGFYGNTSSIGNATDVNKAGIALSVAEQVNASSFTWDAENKKLVVVSDPSAFVAEAVAAVTKLQELKTQIAENLGTEPGQYNVTEASVGGAENLAIWNNLENYDAADDAVYATITVNDARKLVSTLKKMAVDVRIFSKTPWPLNLDNDVTIVTLQWGTNYVGIADGGRAWHAGWQGNANNSTTRVALVKRKDGKYAIACQGIFMQIDGDEQMTEAHVTDPNEATGFNIIRSSENGLTIYTDDRWFVYCPGDTKVTNNADNINDDLKVNAIEGYNIIKENMTKVADNLYMSAITVPFKVAKPEVEGYHMYTVKLVGEELVTEEVNSVDAGVPFIYVSTREGADTLNIVQENQAYAAPSAETALKGWYLNNLQGTGDTPKNFYFAVRDGVFGFYNDANPSNINQAAVSGKIAEQMGAVYFTWNAETNKLEAATNAVEITYNVVFNGQIVKSEVVSGVIGDKFSVPASFVAPFTTFSLSAEDSTKVIEESCEVNVIAEMNAPFEISTSIEDAHWYNLGIRDQHWVRVHDREPYQPIVWGDVTNDDLRTPEYQWAFMGNPYELYIYNKSNTAQTLGVVNDDYVKLLDGQTAWELLEQGADGFVLRVPGSTNSYLNQNGGSGNGRDLKFWKNDAGRNDGGSTFKVYEVPLLVDEAIALFTELQTVVADAAQNPNIEYTYTEADNALLDGGYETAAGYEGKTDEEVKALMTEFQALITRIKDARPTGLKELNIVTLKWNNYVSMTAGGAFEGVVAPNDANGRIAIIKKEGGYQISVQGLFVKVNEDKTVSMVAEEEATLLTVTGTVADGLTIKAGELYLSGEALSVVEERPTQVYLVNAYASTTEIATKDKMQEAANKLYMADYCFPFSVSKPENDKEHYFYTLKVAESTEDINIIEMVEVDTVAAGVPFVYITNSTKDTETRLNILGDSVQTYAATPATEGLLTGYYVIPADREGKMFYGEEEWFYGFYNDVKPNFTNGAYVNAEAAAAINAEKIWLDDEDEVFKATDAEGNDITTAIEKVLLDRAGANGAIYNLQGVRVEKIVKGQIYIVNGKKFMVK